MHELQVTLQASFTEEASQLMMFFKMPTSQ
jgi:hypothetical protein